LSLKCLLSELILHLHVKVIDEPGDIGLAAVGSVSPRANASIRFLELCEPPLALKIWIKLGLIAAGCCAPVLFRKFAAPARQLAVLHRRRWQQEDYVQELLDGLAQGHRRDDYVQELLDGLEQRWLVPTVRCYNSFRKRKGSVNQRTACRGKKDKKVGEEARRSD
jgi:hypothetical protein